MAVAVIGLVIYMVIRMRRRAEDKVRASELILTSDVQVLAKSNSRLLEDAIALLGAQTFQGPNDGD